MSPGCSGNTQRRRVSPSASRARSRPGDLCDGARELGRRGGRQPASGGASFSLFCCVPACVRLFWARAVVCPRATATARRELSDGARPRRALWRRGGRQLLVVRRFCVLLLPACDTHAARREHERRGPRREDTSWRKCFLIGLSVGVCA